MLSDSNVQYIAAIIAIAGAIVGVTIGAGRIWKQGLRIHRVMLPNDPVLETASELYERRLDENVRDNSADFRRWLDENPEARLAGNRDVTILFYVATQNDEAKAFFYAEFYQPVRLLLISYLVTHESKVGTRAAMRIMRSLNSQLRRLDCHGLVFELEQPCAKDRNGWLGRWYRFEQLMGKRSIRFMRLDIPYVQPKLSLWEPGYEEEPQYLFYGSSLGRPPLPRVSRDEVAAILETVYNAWYAGSFEDDAERNHEYREYIANLCEQIKAQLPEWISAQPRPPLSSVTRR
jgi:hypothetical protein